LSPILYILHAHLVSFTPEDAKVSASEIRMDRQGTTGPGGVSGEYFSSCQATRVVRTAQTLFIGVNATTWAARHGQRASRIELSHVGGDRGVVGNLSTLADVVIYWSVR
jgi:hypothetical protein